MDHAIRALENYSLNDLSVNGDLAGAYYIRYKRDGQPVDLLQWLKTAQSAPASPATAFNRALAQEALGLTDDAIASWRECQRDKSQWAVEAGEHVAKLKRVLATDAALKWEEVRAKLPDLLRRGDRAGVAAAINDFPLAAQKYFEDEVLTEWANDPAYLPQARLLAEELTRRLRDRFAVDIITTIEGATPARRILLARAQLEYHTGRLTNAADVYARSAQLFRQAGSPQYLLANLRQNSTGGTKESLAAVAAIERDVSERRYAHLLARCHATRAYVLHFNSRYFEELDLLDDARDEYTQLGDHEGAADARVAAIGAWSRVGQLDQALRLALTAVSDSNRIVEVRRRHALFGDTGKTVTTLGYPRIALAYQKLAIQLIRRNLAATLDNVKIRQLQNNLGIALRGRAAIEANVGDLADASRDVDEATRLLGDNSDSATLGVQARIEEVRGVTDLHVNPRAAVEAFTGALQLVADSEFHSFRAALYTRRAEAFQLLNRGEEAKTDLRSALAELQAEEQSALNNRTATAEDAWSTYFSRSQKPYRQLIRQLFDEGRIQEAWEYAERARGYEPLNLVLSRRVPESFRQATRNGRPASLASISGVLPPGTFMFEYCVLDDVTLVWIISNDHPLGFAKLPIGRERIELWAKWAQSGDRTTFEAGLFAQYEKLIAAPLSVARQLAGNAPMRLVLIPDGPMHGLALAASRSNSPSRRYLIQDMPIEFDGSATLYLLSLLRDKELRADTRSNILLIGDPAASDAYGLERLRGAKDEIAKLEKRYGAGATVRGDTAATIPEFLTLAKQSAIIHIAAHSIVNAHIPSRSAVLLAPSGGDSGALDAEELLNKLTLDRTRLIVLASCSSAGGLPVGPEGVAPLVRPLIAAGAPAVIGTLWPITDATTPSLLVSFHDEYLKGRDAAEALQHAQIEMLESEPNWPASTWAAFQVIGHASSPNASRAINEKEKPP
jgi:CHAT domain-containing protein